MRQTLSDFHSRTPFPLLCLPLSLLLSLSHSLSLCLHLLFYQGALQLCLPCPDMVSRECNSRNVCVYVTVARLQICRPPCVWMLFVKPKVICIHVLRGYVIIFVCVAEQLAYSNVFIYVFVVCRTSAQHNRTVVHFYSTRGVMNVPSQTRGKEGDVLASRRRISSQMQSYTISVSTTASVIHFVLFLFFYIQRKPFLLFPAV